MSNSMRADDGGGQSPSDEGSTGTADEVSAEFLSRVMGEIDDEVRRRRAAGEFPPTFERRLDRMFSRFTPVGVEDGHFEETLKLADRAAYIDIEVPTRSEKPGISALKRFLRKMIAWYLNYVVQQLTHFTSSTMRVLHMVDERLQELEEEVGATGAVPLEVSELPGTPPDLDPWVDGIVARLSGQRGRILHAECADGRLLIAMVAAGLDAYGVDPRPTLLDRAAADGADVRCEDAVEHLRSVSDLGLSGLVLSDCIDRLGSRTQRELAALTQSKLAPGGVLVMVGTSPNRWARSSPVVERDLAPGRPLHAETWCHLLAERGFSSISVEWGENDEPLGRVPASEPGAAAVNPAFARLEEALFGPRSYLVSAVRSGRVDPGPR